MLTWCEYKLENNHKDVFLFFCVYICVNINMNMCLHICYNMVVLIDSLYFQCQNTEIGSWMEFFLCRRVVWGDIIGQLLSRGS